MCRRRNRPIQLIIGVISLGVLVHTKRAFADSYGPAKPRGGGAERELPRLLLGFENLFGYSSVTTTTKLEGLTETSVDTSQFSLLGEGLGNPFARPRLSLDGVFGKRFTVGGAIGYFSGASTPTDDDAVGNDSSGYSLNLRLGVLTGSSKLIVWPRVGLASSSRSSTTSGSATDTLSESSSASALTIEVPLLLRMNAFALAVGPAFYVRLGGDIESQLGGGLDPVVGESSVGGFGINVSGYVFP